MSNSKETKIGLEYTVGAYSVNAQLPLEAQELLDRVNNGLSLRILNLRRNIMTDAELAILKAELSRKFPTTESNSSR